MSIRISSREMYEIYREQVRHEDDLINQRLSWLLPIEGVLLVAFTTVLSVDELKSHSIWLNGIIAGFGFVFGLFTFSGLATATDSIRRLRIQWNKYAAKRVASEPEIEDFPPLCYKSTIPGDLLFAGSGIPFIAMWVWGALSAVSIIYNAWPEASAAGWMAALVWLLITLMSVSLVVVFLYNMRESRASSPKIRLKRPDPVVPEDSGEEDLHRKIA
jgi:hypothetical protein